VESLNSHLKTTKIDFFKALCILVDKSHQIFQRHFFLSLMGRDDLKASLKTKTHCRLSTQKQSIERENIKEHRHKRKEDYAERLQVHREMVGEYRCKEHKYQSFVDRIKLLGRIEKEEKCKSKDLETIESQNKQMEAKLDFLRRERNEARRNFRLWSGELEFEQDFVSKEDSVELLVREKSRMEGDCIDLSNQLVNDHKLNGLNESRFRYLKRVITMHIQGNRLNFALPNLVRFEYLQNVNLSDNTIGDYGFLQLLQGADLFHILKTVNLSNNQINGKLVAIGNLLSSSSIEELNLSGNLLGLSGIAFIGSASIESSNIRDLNISRNRQSHSKRSDTSPINHFCEALSKSKSLTHLDISYNYLSKDLVSLISKSLLNNRVLTGLHLTGNFGRVDIRGFVVPIDSFNDGEYSLNCWRCNNMKPVRFEFFCDKTSKEESCWLQATVAVHLAKNNWDPIELLYDASGQVHGKNRWSIDFMLPIKDNVFYYFSVNNKIKLGSNQLVASVKNVLVSDDLTLQVGPTGQQNFLVYSENYYSTHLEWPQAKPRLPWSEFHSELNRHRKWCIQESIFASQLATFLIEDFSGTECNQEIKKSFGSIVQCHTKYSSECGGLKLGDFLLWVTSEEDDLVSLRSVFSSLATDEQLLPKSQLVHLVYKLSKVRYNNCSTLGIRNVVDSLLRNFSTTRDSPETFRKCFMYNQSVDEWLKTNIGLLGKMFHSCKMNMILFAEKHYLTGHLFHVAQVKSIVKNSILKNSDSFTLGSFVDFMECFCRMAFVFPSIPEHILSETPKCIFQFMVAFDLLRPSINPPKNLIPNLNLLFAWCNEGGLLAIENQINLDRSIQKFMLSKCRLEKECAKRMNVDPLHPQSFPQIKTILDSCCMIGTVINGSTKVEASGELLQLYHTLSNTKPDACTAIQMAILEIVLS